jgi:IS30 family transposase
VELRALNGVSLPLTIIAQMNEKKISQAEIARRLGRDRSTICRELRRNFWHDQEVPIAEGYWHVTVYRLAAARRRQPVYGPLV